MNNAATEWLAGYNTVSVEAHIDPFGQCAEFNKPSANIWKKKINKPPAE